MSILICSWVILYRIGFILYEVFYLIVVPCLVGDFMFEVRSGNARCEDVPWHVSGGVGECGVASKIVPL